MLETLSWLDWAIIAIILVSTLISVKRGFFKEALSLFIWIFAVVASVMFADQLAVVLTPYIDSASLAKIAAMAILFILSLVVGAIISMLMSQLIKITGLSGTDRVLGMVFGALRGVLVVLVVLMIGKHVLPLEQESWWQASVIAPHLNRMETWMVTMATQLRDMVLPLVSGHT
ncbi:Colicin V production protein [BD1-7 clade bacterium]|uniref:Colicin V production protein n=1 Tax=BD1-7 clade bacterium TaxID=2029982 RepID=A0A5S9NT47_9GAMM|nr:Colicin V production protein [BD1-7 clade bacterium]CAA0093846.1 Colicin V production protein [BD1-7 clade bacterium]CAA0107402.1 Colicin V production protein [BD1-7 clade bacterium]